MTHEEKMALLEKERQEIEARFDALMERGNKASTIEEIDAVNMELDKLVLECIKGVQGHVSHRSI